MPPRKFSAPTIQQQRQNKRKSRVCLIKFSGSQLWRYFRIVLSTCLYLKRQIKTRVPLLPREISDITQLYHIHTRNMKTVHDVQAFFRYLGQTLSDVDVAHYLSTFTTWREGLILSLHQLLRVMTELKKVAFVSRMHDTTEAFIALGGDRERKGIVQASELRSIVKEFELTIDIDTLIKESDQDESGQVDYNEFKQMLGLEDEHDERRRKERRARTNNAFGGVVDGTQIGGDVSSTMDLLTMSSPMVRTGSLRVKPDDVKSPDVLLMENDSLTNASLTSPVTGILDMTATNLWMTDRLGRIKAPTLKSAEGIVKPKAMELSASQRAYFSASGIRTDDVRRKIFLGNKNWSNTQAVSDRIDYLKKHEKSYRTNVHSRSVTFVGAKSVPVPTVVPLQVTSYHQPSIVQPVRRPWSAVDFEKSRTSSPSKSILGPPRCYYEHLERSRSSFSGAPTPTPARVAMVIQHNRSNNNLSASTMAGSQQGCMTPLASPTRFSGAPMIGPILPQDTPVSKWAYIALDEMKTSTNK
eukprot:PhF_6_TR32364/c0_g1_i2/m.47998